MDRLDRTVVSVFVYLMEYAVLQLIRILTPTPPSNIRIWPSHFQSWRKDSEPSTDRTQMSCINLASCNSLPVVWLKYGLLLFENSAMDVCSVFVFSILVALTAVHAYRGITISCNSAVVNVT